MSTYATVYINGEIVCAVHYDGYLSNLGWSLLNLVSRGYCNWKDVLNVCKEHTLVFIHLKYVREDYNFCYKCGAYNKKQFYWPKEPTPEFLQNGTHEDEDRDPITNDWGWGANNDYDYNLLGNKLFVRLPMWYKTWFPWVLVDEKLILDESKLGDIYCEMHGVLEVNEIDHELHEKVRNDGPVSAGINLLRTSKSATEYMPWDPMVWVIYGAALKASGNINECINAYKKATELKPDNPDFWWKYGQVLEDNNIKNQALASYTRTTQLLPNDYNNWEKFVDKLKNMKEKEKLIDVYEMMIKFLESKPKSLVNLKKVGVLYNEIDKKEQSTNAFKDAISEIAKLERPSSIDFEREKLKELLEEINFHEIIPFLDNMVLESYKQSALENPNDPNIWYLLGKLYFNLNELNNASKVLEKTISIIKEITKEKKELPYDLKRMRENLVNLLKNASLTNLLEELTFEEKIPESESKILKDLENLIGKRIKLLDKFESFENNGYKVQNNHIIALKIEKCDFKSLPESIGDLTFLEVLKLRSNKIMTLPDSIGELRNLRELDLDFNDVTILPNSIGKLEKLEKLDLMYNKNLSTLPLSIKNIEKLKELNINNAKLNPIPDIIWNLTSLEFLFAKDLKISEIPESIGNLSSLKELHLNSNNLRTIPSNIGKLNKLETLNLRYNENLTSLPKSIENLNALTKLDLSSTNLNPLPESIGNLKALKELIIDDLKLITLPATMKNLVSLEKLSLSRNSLNPLPRILSEIKSLKELNLHNNKISTIPDFICNLENLETLSFWYNKITTLPETIRNLKSLKNLNLNDNQIIALPTSIGNLKSLEQLELNNNNLKNLPLSLLNLNSLKSISLYENSLDLQSNIIKKLEEKEVLVNY